MFTLNDFERDRVYDADEIAHICGVHRTTVHKRIFSNVPTRKVGRKETTTGASLIDYFVSYRDLSSKLVEAFIGAPARRQ